jgi:signal peptidase II
VTQPDRAGAWRLLALVAVATVVLDQATKAIAAGAIDPGERVEVLFFLDLVHVTNEGVAFGFLDGADRTAVVLVTIAALALVLAWFTRNPARPWGWLAVGLLVGGAVGNLADRAFRDGVVDFIDLPTWPSFNVADIAITAGAVIMVLAVLSDADDSRSG